MLDSLIFSFSKPIDAEQLLRLYQEADWTRTRGSKDIRDMLAHTTLCLGVWQEGELVAFARILTDHRYRALLDDVIVGNTFREHGIATRMIQEIKKRLSHVELIVLGCEDALVPFYEKLGFQKSIHTRMEIRRSPDK